MAVKTSKSIFYHIPKTGGIWVKEAMRRSGLPYGRCRERKVHHPFGLKREHSTPQTVRDEDKEGLYSFCFVRHPVGWLKSFWAYRVKTQYLDKKFPLDRIWDDTFERFVLNVLETYPDGFVTELYRFYLDGNEMKYIGHQETLVDDLVEALWLAGEEFDEGLLRSTRWRNISSMGKRLGRMCVLSDETRTKVHEAEAWVLNRFYSEEHL